MISNHANNCFTIHPAQPGGGGFGMGKYLLKRLLTVIPVFLGITMLVYFMSSLAPGSPIELLMADPFATAADIEKKRHELGLDQPVAVQYLLWLKELLRGNFGISYRTYGSVLELVSSRIGPTLILTGFTTLLSLCVAIPLGTVAAYKPYSLWDYASSGLSFAGAATPNFFAAMLLIYLFSIRLGLLPTGGMYDTSGVHTWGMLLRHLIMPALVLSIQQVGSFIRHMRGSMIEVLNEDYIRTARAKGLWENAVLIRHGLRNALIPILTQIGMNIPFLIGGAVVTEQIFGWPGLGSLMVTSIQARDYPVIMGITVFVSLAVLLGNIVVDVLYTFLDPRIRYD